MSPFLFQKIRHIATTDLARNSAKLLTANVFAQAIGLIVYPILTRLYTPEDFGLLNLFLQIGGILVIISTAEYYNAIVLPKSEKSAVGVFHFGVLLLLITSGLCALCLPFSTPIAALFYTPELASFLWLLPLFVCCGGFWNLLNYWYIRQKQFGAIGRYQMTQNTLNATAKVSFGFGGILRGGLIYSAVLAPLISLIISILVKFKTLKPLFVFDKKESLKRAKEYLNFPKFSLPTNLVNQLSNALPVLLLTPFFGLSEIGYFGMATLLAFTPINIISRSLYQTFYQRTVEKVQNRLPIRHHFRQFRQKTLLVVVPSFALLYFVLPDLTRLLLGNDWEISGEYIRFCLPWLTMLCLVSPINYISDIFQQQRKMLYFEIALLTVRILALAVSIYLHSFQIAIITYSCGSCLVLAARLAWMMRLVKRYEATI